MKKPAGKLVLRGLGLLLLVGLALVVFRGPGPDGSGRSGSPGLRLAPDFALPDASGRLRRLSDFEGRPALVHFWASWCPPCIEELPEFAALARDFAREPVVFVAVSLDERWENALRVLPASREGSSANLVSLLDPRQELAAQYGSYRFPETYLLDAAHRVAYKWVGPQEWGEPRLRKRIREQLGIQGR
jgi:cytochrome c biogenesis protein CcmG, thiol:disulfide interchange protein DsbE